eukprot:COSAG06_NODE_65449_length_257_cov_0.582278_1_plen_24_part_01
MIERKAAQATQTLVGTYVVGGDHQ